MKSVAQEAKISLNVPSFYADLFVHILFTPLKIILKYINQNFIFGCLENLSKFEEINIY